MAAGVKIVIDHVAGSRRGQRQELAVGGKVRFGRHPDCEVSFDAHRDIDASSRHAELRRAAAGWVLVDVGSSNGTFVDGHRVTEAPIQPGAPAMVEFGPGGPRLRLFLGEDEQVALLEAPALAPVKRTWLWIALGALAFAVLFIVAAIAF
jgi:hypothetical protein